MALMSIRSRYRVKAYIVLIPIIMVRNGLNPCPTACIPVALDN